MNWVQLEEDLIRDEGVRLQRYICLPGITPSASAISFDLMSKTC